jgi:hypothetical protein
MSRATIIIWGPQDRFRAADLVRKVPCGTLVSFKDAKRTLDQNSKMWAMLTDIARQVEWHGLKLRPNDWKLIFLDALRRELRIVPNLDGTGFVALNQSSSDLTKEEMSNMIELMFEFGARHGVVFNEPDEEPEAGDAA